MTAAITFAVVFAAMLVETAVSVRHDRQLRSLGAVEPAGDVYRAMAVAYPATFVAILGEGAVRGVRADAWFAAGALIFVAAKILKYWAIATLGRRWTFRVLVPPGSTRILRGPYRWLTHPNYVAVAGELAGLAVAMHAIFAGPLSLTAFGYLMMRRIGIEEAALGAGR